MKFLKNRYIVGSVFLLLMWPMVVLGFIAFWFGSYAIAGWGMGQEVYKWICSKVEG